MKTTTRVIHRVLPLSDESVIGYLMRVAYRNHLLGPEELIIRIIGNSTRNLFIADQSTMAYICLTRAEEIRHLTGFEQWHQGESRWWIASEWIAKSSFVMNRSSKVCPVCLAESPHLRGLWNLSLYTVCAKHQVRLVDTCPNCMRRLKWNRRKPEMCGCKQNLSVIDLPLENCHASSLAKILAYRVEPKYEYLQNIPLDTRIVERLAGLSLDGVCKTIWFLGHCLANLGQHATGHGRRKPSGEYLESMAEQTFHYLQQWPQSIGVKLKCYLMERFHAGFTSTECHQLLAPLDYYFQSSLKQPELHFLAHSYQQYLQHIWRVAGKRYPTSDFEKQLFLPF